MRIKSKPTVNNRYLAECRRMESEKALEIKASKRLIDERRRLGIKRGEGRVGAKSRYAVLNAIRTEGKEVMTEAGRGFWKDMERRYHWQAPDGIWEDGNSANGRFGRVGKVSERYIAGKGWFHWDNRAGTWVPGEKSARRGIR